jgi:hypothetical protein
MNRVFNIRYFRFDDFDGCSVVSAIHICRSGAWTPPWLDNKLDQFVEATRFTYETVDCPERKWDPANISLSDQIDYLMA